MNLLKEANFPQVPSALTCVEAVLALQSGWYVFASAPVLAAITSGYQKKFDSPITRLCRLPEYCCQPKARVLSAM